MIPWVLRGFEDGVLTSAWPRRPDPYFDEFAAAVRPADGPVDPETARRLVDLCPTRAIGPGDAGRLTLDRGRCTLCGRCVAALPAAVEWEYGADTAHTARGTLVAGGPPESGEALDAVRADLARRVRRLRRSVHVRHVDSGSDGSDEWEVQALLNPVYDVNRLGIFLTASPRHADVLLITGVGARGMSDAVHATYEAMPDPRVVIACGTDAVSGGMFARAAGEQDGAGRLLPVDVWVPGAPPSPFSLLHALLLALGRVGERS